MDAKNAGLQWEKLKKSIILEQNPKLRIEGKKSHTVQNMLSYFHDVIACIGVEYNEEKSFLPYCLHFFASKTSDNITAVHVHAVQKICS